MSWERAEQGHMDVNRLACSGESEMLSVGQPGQEFHSACTSLSCSSHLGGRLCISFNFMTFLPLSLFFLRIPQCFAQNLAECMHK